MKCALCQNETGSNGTICPVCGFENPDIGNVNYKSASNKKASSDKPFFIRIKERLSVITKNKKIFYSIAAAAAILIIVLLKNIFISSQNENISVFTDEANKCVVVFSGNKMISNALPGELSGNVCYSVDSRNVAFLTYFQDSDSSYYTLYTVKNKKINKITSNISASFKLSSNGNAICYLDRDGALHLYKNSSDSVIAQSVQTYCLSPNGKTVLFNAYDDAGLSINLYCCRNSSVSEIGAGLAPAAVTDSAKLIYAFDADYKTLYTVTPDGKSKNKLCDIKSDGLYFTNDLSQAVFTSDTGTYICASGSVRKLIFSNLSAVPIVGKNTNSSYLDDKHSVTVTPYDNLSDMYYEYTGNSGVKGLAFVDSSYNISNICSEITEVKASEDCKRAAYTSKDNMLYISKNGKEGKQSDSSAFNIDISSNGKYIIFTDNDNNYHISNGTKTIKTIQNVKFISITVKGKICYILSDNPSVLYTSNRGNKERVKSSSVQFATFSSATSTVLYSQTDKNQKLHYAVIS